MQATCLSCGGFKQEIIQLKKVIQDRDQEITDVKEKHREEKETILNKHRALNSQIIQSNVRYHKEAQQLHDKIKQIERDRDSLLPQIEELKMQLTSARTENTVLHKAMEVISSMPTSRHQDRPAAALPRRERVEEEHPSFDLDNTNLTSPRQSNVHVSTPIPKRKAVNNRQGIVASSSNEDVRLSERNASKPRATDATCEIQDSSFEQDISFSPFSPIKKTSQYTKTRGKTEEKKPNQRGEDLIMIHTEWQPAAPPSSSASRSSVAPSSEPQPPKKVERSPSKSVPLAKTSTVSVKKAAKGKREPTLAQPSGPWSVLEDDTATKKTDKMKDKMEEAAPRRGLRERTNTNYREPSLHSKLRKGDSRTFEIGDTMERALPDPWKRGNRDPNAENVPPAR
ncbi:hypothetical protein PROFUN_12783 [Planoprotostelium fungivorum]|uniref:Uncharacterized protein n=1 Tax=Planoprotostelium fungivorum TaxID=1890364 RepID=A0A2P6N6I1_9EUKA|nr:hypothetical protein PROFUN_12783 [Planoprotostelium fungivorum]